MRKKIRAILTVILMGIAMPDVIEGRCPKCGALFYGWALLIPRHRMCNKCGSELEIIKNSEKLPGYSPFTAEEYHMDQAAKDPSSISKDKPPEKGESGQNSNSCSENK